MKKIFKYAVLSSAIVSLSAVSLLAHSHGYVTYPKARQVICNNDGGYWWPQDGSGIPNAACREAFLETGIHPFQQLNEFAVLTPDFNNQQAVQRNIPNGTLCAGASPNKAGMNIVSPEWQKTRITPDAQGNITFTFHATAPHAPHFWKFYLTKPGFDPNTETLTWEALELIQEHGNIVAKRGNYEMQIQIPEGRAGDAILYTHWQRIDPAGEGFYNCSDITIVGEGDPNNPDPVVTWQALGAFVDNGLKVNPSDQIWFRVFSAAGQEIVFEKHNITIENSTSEIWADVLAEQINTQYADIVKIGVQETSGEIVYDPQDLYANKVWAQQPDYHYELDVKAFKPTLQVSGLKQQYALSNGQVSLVAKLDGMGEFNVLVEVSSGPSKTVALANNAVSVGFTFNAVGQYQLTATPDNGLQPQTYDFTITEAPDTSESTWDAGKTYAKPCALVTHNGQDWNNQWWTQGDEPGAQAWGVWRSTTEKANNSCR